MAYTDSLYKRRYSSGTGMRDEKPKSGKVGILRKVTEGSIFSAKIQTSLQYAK